MTAPWWNGPLVGLDLETTAPDPQEARIVTAAVATCSRDGIDAHAWLADPGVPIPAEATAVHGITDEQVKADGRPALEVLEDVVRAALDAVRLRVPLVIFNARYDLTVLAREAERHMPSAAVRTGLAAARVVDPLVLDKHLDRYRRSYPAGYTPETAAAAGIPSSRTLEGMCAHYGATLDGAHDATFDAVAACRLAWVMGSRARVVRRVRNAHEGRERAALEREWQDVRGDLTKLHAFQRRIALAERDRFAEYKAGQGEHEEAAKIRAEVGWPILEPPGAHHAPSSGVPAVID